MTQINRPFPCPDIYPRRKWRADNAHTR